MDSLFSLPVKRDDFKKNQLDISKLESLFFLVHNIFYMIKITRAKTRKSWCEFFWDGGFLPNLSPIPYMFTYKAKNLSFTIFGFLILFRVSVGEAAAYRQI